VSIILRVTPGQEGRQEVHREEWSEGDEVRTALVFHGRWDGIATREECLAVEHRGSDRDTTRNQRSDPGDKPIETLIDHIEFDEGRDPVAERAWEKI
jgi:hypothetical protein